MGQSIPTKMAPEVTISSSCICRIMSAGKPFVVDLERALFERFIGRRTGRDKNDGIPPLGRTAAHGTGSALWLGAATATDAYISALSARSLFPIITFTFAMRDTGSTAPKSSPPYP
jgi:hypothetical protein